MNNDDSFFSKEISFDCKRKHSIPIIAFCQTLNKYKIKSLHKTSNRLPQDISVSIKEIDGLLSALTPKINKSISSKKDFVQKNNDISVLSKSFSKIKENAKSPEGLFWIKNKRFVKFFELLNKQKLIIRKEKFDNFAKTIESEKNKELKKSIGQASLRENTNKKSSDDQKNIIQKKDNFKFSPFSRRFIREKNHFETIFVLPPKKTYGRTFLLNI